MSEPVVGQVEATVEYLKRRARVNRKAIFWTCLAALLLWVMHQAKEVTSLLILSYVFSLLIDPIVSRMERYRISRGASIVLLYLFVFLALFAMIAIAVPAIISEYDTLVVSFPNYVRAAIEKLDLLLQRWPSLRVSLNAEAIWADVKQYSSLIGPEHVKNLAVTLGNTLLSGYSITLTILNLTLLPFFVYYITSDLRKIHAFFGSFLAVPVRKQVAEVGNEILSHIYVFFKGQFTVAFILVLLYVAALLLIGLPSAILVGILSGMLCIIPYLGVAIGILVSVTITLFSNPGWWPVAKVLIVYTAIPSIEGSFITPKIIGESLGIHPLGVMLALLIGGQLLGLLGLIIAIPCAAAFRVLMRHALAQLENTGTVGEESMLVTVDG
jgi:predicted PurR-regulated permease PerM